MKNTDKIIENIVKIIKNEKERIIKINNLMDQESLNRFTELSNPINFYEYPDIIFIDSFCEYTTQPNKPPILLAFVVKKELLDIHKLNKFIIDKGYNPKEYFVRNIGSYYIVSLTIISNELLSYFKTNMEYKYPILFKCIIKPLKNVYISIASDKMLQNFIIFLKRLIFWH